VAVPALTENELRAALKALEDFKAIGLNSLRFDPLLPTGVVVSFQRKDDSDEWVLK